MSPIVTLTMNPAVDLSTSVERVEAGPKMRCRAGGRDPGGGGVNVARVAQRLGADVTAVYPAGGLMGELLQQLVAREGVTSVVTEVAQETREDITVGDESSGAQYRFVLPGPHLHGVEWLACLKALAALPRPGVVCASGSLPPGVPDDFYARVAEIAAGWGAKFVLDTSGAPLKAALEAHVHLIKPNLQELCDLAGVAADDGPSLVAACRSLISSRRIEAVALTLGAQGALLVTAQDAWRAEPLPVRVVSAVGAGDSFLGSMLWAWASDMTLREAFRYGAAGGAAAVLESGTELARPEQIRRLVELVVIEEVTGAEPARPSTAAWG